MPRALKKKLLKSTHPLKDDLQLCLYDLLNDGDEDVNESGDWVNLLDRGGLLILIATHSKFFVL